MNNVDIRKIRPMRADVVLCLKPERDVVHSPIIYGEDIDTKTTQYFEVIKTGPDVKIVKEGDIVLCSWMRITEQCDGVLDNKSRKFGITEEKEILAIIG